MRSAFIGIVIVMIPIAILPFTHQSPQVNPTTALPVATGFRPVTILVADFEQPDQSDQKNYGVTETVLSNLRGATVGYQEVTVKPLGRIITEKDGGREVAKAEGKKQNASIVIWGSYRKTPTNVQLNVNFEVLDKPKDSPEDLQKVTGQIWTAPVAALDAFSVQTELSKDMTYLTLVVLGLSRYEAGDWDGCTTRLTAAMETLDREKTSIPALNLFLPYRVRGRAFQEKKNFSQAIADFNQALGLVANLIPKYPQFGDIYSDLGNAYYLMQDYDRAISNYTQALGLYPNPYAYYMRGSIRVLKGEFDQAFSDFNQALSLDPKSSLAYMARGIIHAKRKDYDQTIADLDKALEFGQNLPKHALANIYEARGKARFAKLTAQFESQALMEFNQSSKPETLKPETPKSKASSPEQGIVNIFTLRLEVPLGNRDIEQALSCCASKLH